MTEDRTEYITHKARPARKSWRTMTAGDKRLAGKLWARLATQHRGAEHARKASEIFAQKQDSRSDITEWQVVAVVEANGTEHRFEIDCEMVPEYTARISEVKK